MDTISFPTIAFCLPTGEPSSQMGLLGFLAFVPMFLDLEACLLGLVGVE